MRTSIIRLWFVRSALFSISLLLATPVLSQTLTWQQVYTIFGDPCVPNESGPPVLNFAASQDSVLYFSDPGALYRSSDRGVSWEYPTFQLAHIQTIQPMEGDTLLIGLYGSIGGVFWVTEQGDSWETTGLTENVDGIVASSDRRIVYAWPAATGMYRSIDRGATWTLINPTWDVESIRIGPRGRVYVKTSTELRNFSDDGETWQAPLYDLFPFPLSEAGYLLATDSDGLFISSDDGLNWSRVLDITSPALVTNRENMIFAISSEGVVYRSFRPGEDWERLNDGFPDTCSRRAAVTIDVYGHIVTGTWGGLVYRTIESTLTAVENPELPDRVELLANYPNPFNPRTTISYVLDRPAEVALRVYSVLGTEISTLERGFLPAGEYSIDFEASGLPSGIYLYTLTAGAISETRKMVLLK